MAPVPPETGALDSYRSRVIVGVVIAFTITSSVSLFLRIYAKNIQRLRLAAEDWTIMTGQVAVYGMAMCAILAVTIGNEGHHVTDAPTKVPPFLKSLIALQVFYAITLGLIKLSICMFYNRIFPIKPFQYWCWAVMAIIVAWSCMVVLTALLLCRPFAFNWDRTIPGGSCADQPTKNIIVGVLDLIIDVMVGALPLPMIWGLKVSMGNKMGLLAIFSAGISTMVIAIVRVQSLVAMNPKDITYSAAYPTLWSFLEPAIGISVACAPLLRGLYRHVRGHTQASTGGSNSGLRGTKSSDASHFRRLDADDAYPLASTTADAHGADGENRGPVGRAGMRPPPGIVIQREWRTESSKLQA